MLAKKDCDTLMNPHEYKKNSVVYDLLVRNIRTGKKAVVPASWVSQSGKIKKKYKSKYLAILLSLKKGAEDEEV